MYDSNRLIGLKLVYETLFMQQYVRLLNYGYWLSVVRIENTLFKELPCLVLAMLYIYV